MIRRTCCRASPRFGRVGLLRGGKNAGIPGAGVGKVRFEEEVQGTRLSVL